jgi:hypothetical protein
MSLPNIIRQLQNQERDGSFFFYLRIGASGFAEKMRLNLGGPNMS